MTLLTYNVLYDDPVRWGAEYAWERRKPGIAALLKQHPADLLGFQELKAGQRVDVGNMLGGEFLAVIPFESDAARPSVLNVTFFRKQRYELERHGAIELSSDTNRRHATWATLRDRVSARRFCHLNLHLTVRGDAERRDSLQEVVRFVEALDPDLPVIVSGDFNTTCQPIENAFIGCGLQPAIGRSEMQFNTQSGTKVDRVTQQVGKQAIDQVFVRNVIRVEAYAILPDRFDERYPSDHLPVKVVLSM
jgi:endonuclease/exonuclease/phosphatase family metal-dependent hydrolase